MKKRISDVTRNANPGLHWFLLFTESGVSNFTTRFDEFQKYLGMDGAQVSIGDSTPESDDIFTLYSEDRNADISVKNILIKSNFSSKNILSYSIDDQNFSRTDLKATFRKRDFDSLECSDPTIVWTKSRPIMRAGDALSVEEVWQMFDTGNDFHITKIHFSAMKTHSEYDIGTHAGYVSLSDAYGLITNTASFSDILKRTCIGDGYDYYDGSIETGILIKGGLNYAEGGGYYVTHYGDAGSQMLTGRIGFEGQYISSFSSFLTGV